MAQTIRTGTGAALVVAGTKAEALEALAALEIKIGRKIVWSGPNHQRIQNCWHATAVINASDPI